MSDKLQKRVNGGCAIYFGIGSLIATLASFVGMLVMFYKISFQEMTFNWELFLMLVFFLLVSAAMSYALLRVGYDEIED